MDGNLIAQAPGDGSAIMMEPFKPDQTAFLQMNQALIDQQQQRAVQKRKDDEAREAQKAAWVKEMKGNHKYDPADRPIVEREQKKLLDLIYNYDGSPKAQFAIDDAQVGLGKFINDSGTTYDEYLKRAADYSVNADRVYFNNEDKLQASRTINNAETLEEAFGVLGQRQANIEAFGQAEEKIKDVPKYLATEVTKLKPVSYETKQVPTEFGYVSTNVPKYDPEAVKNLGSLLRKENRSIRETYKTDEEIFNAMNDYLPKTEKPTAKGMTSDQKGGVSGGGTITTGKMVLSPVQEMVYTDVESQDRAYKKYKDAFMKLIADESDDKKFLALHQAMLSPEAYKKAHPYSEKIEVIPLSTLGLAENPIHKFNVTINGVETEVFGQPIKYAVTKDAFIVQPDKDSPKTYLAKVSKNPQYLTDSDQTIDDFRKAVKKVKGGNYVTTGKGGDVVSSEKEKGVSLKQVYPQTKEEWDKAPKGSFYITKSGKKITK